MTHIMTQYPQRLPPWSYQGLVPYPDYGPAASLVGKSWTGQLIARTADRYQWPLLWTLAAAAQTWGGTEADYTSYGPDVPLPNSFPPVAANRLPRVPNAIRFRYTNARFRAPLLDAINELADQLNALNVCASAEQFTDDAGPIGVGLIPPTAFQNVSDTKSNGFPQQNTRHIVEPEKWLGGNLLYILLGDEAQPSYTAYWSDKHFVYDVTTATRSTRGATHVDVLTNHKAASVALALQGIPRYNRVKLYVGFVDSADPHYTAGTYFLSFPGGIDPYPSGTPLGGYTVEDSQISITGYNSAAHAAWQDVCNSIGDPCVFEPLGMDADASTIKHAVKTQIIDFFQLEV